jgi:hypothetical protein
MRQSARLGLPAAGVAVAAIVGLGLASCAQDAGPGTRVESLVSVMDLMQRTITPATNQLWSAWEPPETPAEWRLMEEAAVTLLAAANLTGAGGTGERDDAWAREPEWQEFNRAMIAAGQAALEASRRQDAEALLAAGDLLLPPCEGCHQRFNPAVVPAAIDVSP